MSSGRSSVEAVRLPPSRADVDKAAREGFDTIDRAYDFFDRALENVGRLIGIDVNAKPAAIRGTTTRSSRAVEGGGRKLLRGSAEVASKFRVEEIIDAETGIMSWIVTDGTTNKVECETRAMADGVMAALGGSS